MHWKKAPILNGNKYTIADWYLGNNNGNNAIQIKLSNMVTAQNKPIINNVCFLNFPFEPSGSSDKHLKIYTEFDWLKAEPIEYIKKEKLVEKLNNPTWVVEKKPLIIYLSTPCLKKPLILWGIKGTP